MTRRRPGRALDDRVLPVLGSFLRRLDRRSTERVPPSAFPSGPAGRPPLLREVPQLLVVGLAVLLIAGAAVLLARSGPEPPSGLSRPAPPTASADASTGLGPRVGEDVEAYLARARDGLASLRTREPAAGTVALVSLRAYATPAEAATLLAGLQVQRAYVKAQLPAPQVAEVIPLDLRDPVPDLRAGYTRLAARKDRDAAMLRTEADGIDRATMAGARRAAETSIAGADQEAAAYAGGCACVIAFVVTAPATLLAELAAGPQVRAVQVAGPAVALAGLAVVPLLPEATGLVTEIPRPALVGGE